MSHEVSTITPSLKGTEMQPELKNALRPTKALGSFDISNKMEL